MDVQKITNKKLKGDSLTHNELESVIKSYVDNAIDDSIMGKFLKSIHLKGMEIDEIVSLTQIMIDSGETIDFSNLGSFVADKHSTGGVGDKVSIILGPVLAALGIAVPGQGPYRGSPPSNFAIHFSSLRFLPAPGQVPRELQC